MSSLTANGVLNIIIEDHGVTRALRDGTVPVDGVSLNFVDVEPIVDAYRRMVSDGAVAEKVISNLSAYIALHKE